MTNPITTPDVAPDAYESTLKTYIKTGQARRSKSNKIMNQILMEKSTPATASPVVMSSSGGSSGGSGVPVTSSQVNAKWGNPDAAGFLKNYTTTIKTPNGQRLTINKNSASAFSGFLGALAGTGYNLGTVQSYNNRNIAGTNTKSQHAWANAIDINPGVNRGDRLGGGGSRQGNLPKNIASIASKYGLTWGGLWKSADPMHFEYRR
jgi:D-alanyl-D-alanine carboxypeptidase